MVLPAKDYARILDEIQQAWECAQERADLLRVHSDQLRDRVDGATENRRQILYRCRELEKRQDRLLTQADEVYFVSKILERGEK